MKSVGIRKQKWFKTAGVVAFTAQLVGGAGLAGASGVDNAKTCVPTPSFVYGGDPDVKSLTPDSITKWTGSAGYGWNQGSGAQVSFETALANTDPAEKTAHPELYGKNVLVSFMNGVSMPQVDSATTIRVGFDYTFHDPTGDETVSQIIELGFDPASPTSPWNPSPNLCPDAAFADCANDPKTDPATWTSLQPATVKLLKKIGDSPTTGWSGPTGWVTQHTYLWLFKDGGKYYFRVNMALPVRTTGNDPGGSWTSPSIYMDASTFQATGKIVPNFWTEMVTDATAATGPTIPKVTYHFPDWATDLVRDGSNIPPKGQWGKAEIGTPRAVLNGDLSCSGTGVRVEDTAGDLVLWHSAIWNNLLAASNDLSSLAGTLKVYDTTAHAPAANNMSVMLANDGVAVPNASDVHATFLIAPYGSQAAGTIWSPLNAGGNDYTCPGAAPGTCKPLPNVLPPIDSKVASGYGPTFDHAAELQLNMSSDWKPSMDYVCAVQTSDAPGSLTWWSDTLGSGPGSACAGKVYLPTDRTGMSPPDASGAGLPAHQCMQVQLSGNSVQFGLKSAFRNMHVAPASLYRETATIDTRGLKKIAGQSYHNIYLYVETRNMPYRVDAGSSPPTIEQTLKTYTAINQYCGRVIIESRNSNTALAAAKSEGIDCTGFNPSVPVPSDEFLTKNMPTMIVHAYADTGATQTIRGKKVPMLTPMTSFGQFITHDATTEGPVFGWNAGLEPFGSTPFQKVGVDTYRLQIPNDGAGHVVTRVEPLPTRRPTCTGTVNMDIVTLLKAIAPLIKVDSALANYINSLIDSLQIECVPLQEVLTKIDGMDWGAWKSWVHYLILQVEATDGCHCQ